MNTSVADPWPLRRRTRGGSCRLLQRVTDRSDQTPSASLRQAAGCPLAITASAALQACEMC